MNRPSIPKGTRDFSPVEMTRRNYIFNTIREVFALYGFQQIETPAMENLSTLMGKYGQEGDKLLYKVLDSGDFRHEVTAEEFSTSSPAHLAATFCEKGLRYDLTVPFARFVVQHRDEIPLPFRRYQIQPVWRADRPQKGRYREFYQCDADIVGSTSLINEVELMQLADEVFHRFGIRVVLKINNRKLLYGIAEVLGATERLMDITVAIDKLDKIGLEKVSEELLGIGLSHEQVERLIPLLQISGSNEEKLNMMEKILSVSETGLRGVGETRTIVETLLRCELHNTMELDLTLARGLNYYTGAIFEAKALDVEMGSILGGGRYDNLTGIFGVEGLSGVGISFGADRIYDVLTQLDLYPHDSATTTKLLFVNFGQKEVEYSLPLVRLARQAGIPTELYPETTKLKKQMSYANAKGIPYVAIVGETEMAEGKITLRNMLTGEQQEVDAEGFEPPTLCL